MIKTDDKHKFGGIIQALELQAGDKNALVCRSRCRILLGDTRGALEDAENALKIDPQFVKGEQFYTSLLGHWFIAFQMVHVASFKFEVNC